MTWTSPHPPAAATPSSRPRAIVVIQKPARNGWPFDPGQLVLNALNELGEFPTAAAATSVDAVPRVTIEIIDRPMSAAAKFWFSFDGTFWPFLLPAVHTEGFDVRFYVDAPGAPRRVYQYEVLERGVLWLPLLPFAWVSLLTPSAKDAFRSTVQRFMHDSAADHAW